MAKNTLFPVSIIIGAIIISVGAYFGLSSQGASSVKVELAANNNLEVITEEEKTLNPLLSLTDDDHVFGNPDAKISLIEYSDFECPFCKRFHPTPELLVEEFEDEVNWVYRHYPLAFHDPAATLEAEATECATEQGGNDAFWDFSKVIYDNTPGNGTGITQDKLIALAGEMDLNEESFKECLDSDKYSDRIKQDFKNGSRLGVSGTPATFVVNHETGEEVLVSGAQSYAKVKAVIDKML